MERTETWNERQRDKYEIELANKRELLSFIRHGLEVAVYWLRQSNQVSMSLTENSDVREFIIPNDSVMDAADHPEYYATEAGLPRQLKRWYEQDQ